MSNRSTPSPISSSISHLSILMTLIALCLIFVEITAHLSHHYKEPIHDNIFKGEPTYFTNPVLSIKQVLTPEAHGKHRSIIMIGIFLIILNPLVRVSSALIYYFRQGDFCYSSITLLLWLILLYSLLSPQ